MTDGQNGVKKRKRCPDRRANERGDGHVWRSDSERVVLSTTNAEVNIHSSVKKQN